MDFPARPRDALAQPTRARLFSMLAELRRPVGTEELARRLGLHPNGVRVHLERLRASGLIARERQTPEARPAARHVDDRPGRAARWRAAERLRRPRPMARATALDAQGGRSARPRRRAVRSGASSRRPTDGRHRRIASCAARGTRLCATARESRRRHAHLSLVQLPISRRRPREPRRRLRAAQGNHARRPGCPRAETRLIAFVPSDPDLAGCLVEVGGLAADGTTAGREHPSARWEADPADVN